MIKYFLSFLLVFLLAGCSTPESSAPVYTGNDPALQAQVTLVYAHATDTAVAQAMQYQAATSQAYQYQAIATQAAAMTQTQQAVEATTTSMAAMVSQAQTAENMTAWANVTTTALVATQDIERARVNSRIVSIWSGVIGVIIAFGLVLAFFGMKIFDMYIDIRARKIQSETVMPDVNGRYPVVPDNGKRLLNPNLQHRAVLDPAKDDLTTEQALINTAMHHKVEETRALAQSAAFARTMAKGMLSASPSPEPVDPGVSLTKPDLPLLPGAATWALMEGWDGKRGIPYGVSGDGMELLDLEKTPHGGVFGKTGEGKSRYFLRPFITAALTAGNRVVIMGKQADFRVFAGHPNVTMLPVQQFTDPEQAARYANFLKQIVVEMNRRDNFLVSRGASTWQQSGRYPTLIVLDEMGNALDMMPPEIRKEAYRWIQGLVQEGRKAGFNVWMASQRAVGFKSIVEQLGRAVFHLADAEASRIALGFAGAEELEHGQFYAKFNRLHRCQAFDPTDEQITAFLAGRRVETLEPVDWIDATVIDMPGPLSQTQPNKAVQRPEHPEASAENITDARILAMYEDMLARDKVSLSRIQREIYGRQIPSEFYHIQQLVKEYQEKKRSETITTTTTTGENQPYTGTLAV